MSNIDVIAYALANGYTDETVIGGGAIKGKNCQIKSKTAIEGGTRITFAWYLDNGTEQTTTLDVMNGIDGEDGKDGSQVEVTPIQKTGTKVGEITVDGHKYTLYAPTGGGGGDAVLSDDLTTAISVGGIDSGVTYEAGTPLETLLRDLLEPTLFPTLTNPSASITYNSSQYYEVKSSVSAMQATVALNRGSINPQYTAESSYRSGEATGYAIATSGADTEYSDSSENSGVFSVPALTRSTKGNIVVTGTASYAQGAQPKDSKGNNYDSPLPAGSVNANKTLTFIQAYFYGASNSATVADFTGLSKSVTAKGQKTFNYTTNNQFMVFAYDSSYGNLKSITDANGFDVTSGWTKNTVTVDGFTYFVYVANSATTDTNAPFTFKY